MRWVLLSLVFAISGCEATTQVGHFTVVSTRVYDNSAQFRNLGRFHGSSHATFGTANVEDAIEDAIRQVPGGIYMTNVTLKTGGFPSGYEVEGDVYGLASPPTPIAAH